MKWISYLTKLSLCFALITSCGTTQDITNTDSETEKNDLPEADFIFVGQVSKAQDSNVSFVKADKNTYVVTVQEILKAPKDQDNFVNRKITVKSDVDLRDQSKNSILFYSNIWLYGESLAVVANKIEPNNIKASDLKKQIDEELQLQQDRSILERIKTAETVVFAKVVEKMKPDIPRTTRESEHNPNWEVAVLDVQEVMKGNQVNQILFPNSMDIHWYQVPKLKVGQEGIFILQPSKDAGISKYLQINDARDFQPANQLNRIKKLIN